MQLDAAGLETLQTLIQVWPRGYKLSSCSTQLSMKFFLLINVKMPTIIGILTFMSGKNSILGILGTSEPKKCQISWYFYTYGHSKFHAQLSWAWKNFYNLFLLINVKMPTIIGILTFMSGKNSILGTSEPKKMPNFLIFYTYGHLKFHAQLSWAWKNFYNLRAWSWSAVCSTRSATILSTFKVYMYHQMKGLTLLCD